ncbi:hypothetical protein RRG08_024278 [Elysia crispata]|uniref:Uncharacterized protein n=1 Tax=Elysia crispata TaxID=231223 RepID=A0AAE0Z3E2_9GAST|nr:hypothetical protein RRG08_024278 [Elysia crispata]
MHKSWPDESLWTEAERVKIAPSSDFVLLQRLGLILVSDQVKNGIGIAALFKKKKSDVNYILCFAAYESI